MRQGIEIYKGGTIRLDTYPSETVEMNMGGFQMLSIESRTVNYTNTFRLPRTPVNMQALGMYAIAGVYKPASSAVLIRSVVFEKWALMSIVGTDLGGDIEVSLNYDPENLIGALQNALYYDLPWVESKGTLNLLTLFDAGADAQALCEAFTAPTTNRTGFFMPHDNTIIPPITGTFSDKIGGFVTVESFFAALQIELGCTVSSGVDFSTMAISNRHIRFYFDPTNYTIDGLFYKYRLRSTFTVSGTNESPSCADILRALCAIRGADFSITGRTINISPIAVPAASSATITPISWSKQAVSGYAAENYIQYRDAGKTNSRRFLSDGVGEDVVLEINAIAPLRSTAGMLVPNTDDILIVRMDAWLGEVQYGAVSDPVDVNAYEPVTWPLASEYSILSAVYRPVIIECETIITPLQAEAIRLSRRIKSIELQGDYWVDAMAYDYLSGRAILTLIKVQ